MISYIIRRLMFMFPTLIGIITITFIVTQFVPGGPRSSVLRTANYILRYRRG